MAGFHDWGFRPGKDSSSALLSHIVKEQENLQQELYVRARDAAWASEREAHEQFRTIMRNSNLTDPRKVEAFSFDKHTQPRRSSFRVKSDLRTSKDTDCWKNSLYSVMHYVLILLCIVLFTMTSLWILHHHLSERHRNSTNDESSRSLSDPMIVLIGFFTFLSFHCEWEKISWTAFLLGRSSVMLIGATIMLSFRSEIDDEASRLLVFQLVAYLTGLLTTFILNTDMIRRFVYFILRFPVKYLSRHSYGPLLNFKESALCLLKLKFCQDLKASEPCYNNPVQNGHPRRALGGFAGGFGGVSGLKSLNPSVMPKIVVPADTYSRKCDMSCPSITDSLSYSLSLFVSGGLADGTDNIWAASTGSCSCIHSDVAQKKHTE